MLSDIITINGLIGADVNGRHICVRDNPDNRNALFSIMADDKLANLVAEIIDGNNEDNDSDGDEDDAYGEPPVPPETVSVADLRDRLASLFDDGVESVELAFDYTDAKRVSKRQHITVDGEDFLGGSRALRFHGSQHARQFLPDANLHGRNRDGEWRSFRLDRIGGDVQLTVR